MADVYMHSRLTEDLIQKRQADINTPLAFMGAQFSDPMYYATFHKEAKRYRQFADRMHDTDTQKLMMNMVDYVNRHPSNQTYSFLFGFIAHYALDVNIHPYVYHHVGLYRYDDPKTHPLRGLHLKFERSIDAVLFEREQKRPSRTLNVTKHYFTVKHVPDEIKTLIANTFTNQFGVDDGDVVYSNSVKYMYNILKRMTHDPLGIKKQLFKLGDLIFRKQDLFFADMSFFGHIEAYDFLNLDHRIWHHPVTNEPSTKSVLDLYQDAFTFATDLLDQVDLYLAGENIDLKTVFTNLSLNSGRECTQSYPFQYFQIYRPKNNS